MRSSFSKIQTVYSGTRFKIYEQAEFHSASRKPAGTKSSPTRMGRLTGIPSQASRVHRQFCIGYSVCVPDLC